MSRSALAMLDRIVAALVRVGEPVPGELIVRDFLGMKALDRARADQLLAASFAGDDRVAWTCNGWTARRERLEAIPLGAPAVAVFAPFVPEVFATIPTAGDGAPRLAISTAGAEEVGRARARGASNLPSDTVALGDIARRVFRYRGPGDPNQMAAALRVQHVAGDTPLAMARAVADVWNHIVSELESEGIADLEELSRLLDARLEAADFTGKTFDERTLAALPEVPGTYRFEDQAGATLYVGRSANLRARICSYFAGPPRDEKDRALRDKSITLDARPSDCAVDAWLEEARFIARFAPALNVQRFVHGDAGGDGVLLVRSTLDARRVVAFVIANGGLAMRRSRLAGPKRTPAIAEEVARAVFDGVDPPPPSPESQRAAAIVESWRRAHPGVPFFEPALHGDRERFVAIVANAIEELVRE